MSHLNAAALPAGPLWRLKIEGRLLNTMGIASMAFSLAVVTCVSLSVLTRTSVGLGLAALMIAGGDLISRRAGSRGWWTGTSLMGTGYALAAFFAQASFYINGVAGLETAYPCWILELLLGAVVTVHAQRNGALRWVCVPFTACLTANVLYFALTSPQRLSFGSFAFDVPAVASIVGMLYLAGLSALYRKVESSCTARTDAAPQLLFRIAHETCFFLAAALALFVPKFCHAGEYAPFWWAAETPVLLAVCWRSNNLVKHALVLGIWALSAVLVLVPKLELNAIACMSVPLSGVAMALTYRFIPSSWPRWQQVSAYAGYLYASAGIAIAVPLLRVGVIETVPFFLVEAGLLLGAALALRDRPLHLLGLVAGAGSVALFGSQWREWGYVMPLVVVAGCYALSITYGRFKRDGLAASDFMPLRTNWMISPREARWLERAVGFVGYVTLIAATYLLLEAPFNTIAMAVEALVLIGFGFAVDKVGHRFSGVVTIFLACGKLWILDLSGAEAGVRTAVGFAVFGVCSITAGSFYLVEYVWLNRKKPDTTNGAPPSEGQ